MTLTWAPPLLTNVGDTGQFVTTGGVLSKRRYKLQPYNLLPEFDFHLFYISCENICGFYLV